MAYSFSNCVGCALSIQGDDVIIYNQNGDVSSRKNMAAGYHHPVNAYWDLASGRVIVEMDNGSRCYISNCGIGLL